MRKIVCIAVCFYSFTAAVAQRGQGWSTQMGRTLGEGTLAGVVEFGWPGASIGALYGLNPALDVGGKLTYNYGLEGIPRYFSHTSELKLQGWARAVLLDGGNANLGITFAPGILLNRWQSATYGGLLLPFAFQLGLPVSDALNFFGALDIPLYVTFGQYSSFNMPVLFGGGVEYFIDRNLAAFGKLQMGPYVAFASGYTDFAFISMLGIAYKL